MKSIQVYLEDGVHGDFKAWCARHGTNMQRRVVDLIESNNSRLVGCEQGTSTNGDAQRGVAKARSKNVKVTLDVTSESKSPAPSPQAAKPAVDQSTCKHSMVIKDSGGSMCFKCGWTPKL